jgi:hypothetical protein
MSFLLTYLCIYLLPAGRRVLLGKLTGSELVKHSPHFMEPEGLLPPSQVPATCPYPKIALPPRPNSWRLSLTLSSHHHLGFPYGPFPSGFPTKTLY